MKLKRYFPIVFIFLSAVPTPLGNFISIPEVLAGFYLLLRGTVNDSLKRISIFGAISITGIGISSLIHGDFSDFIGSIWRIISIIILMIFFDDLLQTESLDKTNLLLFTSLAYLGSLIINAGVYFEQNPWKYGIGTPFIIATLLICEKIHVPSLLRKMLPFFFMLISLHYDARGMAFLCLLTFLSSLLSTRRKEQIHRKKVFKVRIILLAIAITLIAQLGTQIYSAQVLQGKFGQMQRTKWLYQHESNSGNILFLARPELPISICVLKHSWVIGQGSSVKLSTSVRDECIQFAGKLGGYLNSNEIARIFPGDIHFNAHSILFIYLAKGGLLGGAFWLYLLFVFGRFATLHFARHERDYALVFLTLTLILEILISPFSERENLLYAALLLFIARAERERNLN